MDLSTAADSSQTDHSRTPLKLTATAVVAHKRMRLVANTQILEPELYKNTEKWQKLFLFH